MSEKFEEETTACLARIETQMQNLTDIVTRHDKLLYGRNSGSPGLTVRVDRVEQNEERRKWHIRTLWIAFVAWVGKTFLGFMLLVVLASCSTYTIERRVPIFDESGRVVGESYTKLRETVPPFGKKIGTESLYFEDGDRIIEFGRRQAIDNTQTGVVMQQAVQMILRAAMAAQGVPPTSVIPPEPARPRDPGVVVPPVGFTVILDDDAIPVKANIVPQPDLELKGGVSPFQLGDGLIFDEDADGVITGEIIFGVPCETMTERR